MLSPRMVGRGGPGFSGAWGREWVDTHPTPRGGMAAGGFISKLFHLPPIQFHLPPVQSLPPKQKLKRSVRLKGHSGLASPQSRIHRLFDLEDAIPPSDGVVVLNDPLLLPGCSRRCPARPAYPPWRPRARDGRRRSREGGRASQAMLVECPSGPASTLPGKTSRSPRSSRRRSSRSAPAFRPAPRTSRDGSRPSGQARRNALSSRGALGDAPCVSSASRSPPRSSACAQSRG